MDWANGAGHPILSHLGDLGCLEFGQPNVCYNYYQSSIFGSQALAPCAAEHLGLGIGKLYRPQGLACPRQNCASLWFYYIAEGIDHRHSLNRCAPAEVQAGKSNSSFHGLGHAKKLSYGGPGTYTHGANTYISSCLSAGLHRHSGIGTCRGRSHT